VEDESLDKGGKEKRVISSNKKGGRPGQGGGIFLCPERKKKRNHPSTLEGSKEKERRGHSGGSTAVHRFERRGAHHY